MARNKHKTNHNKKRSWLRNNIILGIGLCISAVVLAIGIILNISAYDERDSGLANCENADYSQYLTSSTIETDLGRELRAKMEMYKNAAESAFQDGDMISYNELMAAYYDTLNIYNTSDTTRTVEERSGYVAAKSRCKEGIENTFTRHKETAKWFLISSGIIAGITIVLYVILVIITMKY